MEIKVKNGHQFASLHLQPLAVSRANSPTFAVALTTVRDASTTTAAGTITPETPGYNRAEFAAALDTISAEPTRVDFTSMTRQEMRDWVNDQISSGKMSLDDSTPFMAMTLKISAQGTQLADSATDFTRINFMETARLGIEGALSRNDQEGAKQLQAALALMQEFRGQGHIDTYA
jgi:hypothetical protein